MDGKLNPQRYEQANEVVRIHGLRAICVFNDHREKLVSVRQTALDGGEGEAMMKRRRRKGFLR